MEKLLSTTKKQGGNYATNLNRPTHKKYFLSYVGHENIFCQRTANNYYNQPYSG